jgi:DNA-binding transcriptional ArsR family regulator
MTQSAFPMRAADEELEQEPRVVSFDDADAIIEALGSQTARSIMTALETGSMAPAELADRVDTSIQNVTYHLDRMADAGLVEVVDTSYSPRGAEMDMYAPVSSPVVICLGDDTSERTAARLAGASRSPATPAESD